MNAQNDKAKIKIELSAYTDRMDIREKAIYLIGNKKGFEILTNTLLKNNLENNDLEITKLDFIDNKLNKKLIISYIEDPEVPDGILDKYGYVKASGYVRNEKNAVKWFMSGSEAMVITNLLFGIGLYWDHIHFDPKSNIGEFAVCCYLEETN